MARGDAWIVDQAIARSGHADADAAPFAASEELRAFVTQGLEQLKQD